MNRDAAIDVSVVIPNWNGESILTSCVDSVASDLRASGLRHEIIVVDDKSQDDSVRVLREHHPFVQIILNPRNSGFAFSCNRGMRRARGDFILLLNSDADVQPGTMRRVWEFMSAHPEVGGVGCKVISGSGVLERSCREFPSPGNLLKSYAMDLIARWRPALAAAWSVNHWPHDCVRTVDWIHMVFFMISRTAFEAVGGLDEQFFMYGEDADYGWRLNRARFHVTFLPDASVMHARSTSGNKRWGVKAVVKRQFAMHILLRKWYSPYHVLGYRIAMTILQVTRLVRGTIEKVIWKKSSADIALNALLIRCNLGLIADDEK